MEPHRVFEPAIHYWGTPVVLLSTRNEDGSTNLAPMSSIWWLGWSAMLGLDATSKTVENLRRDRECVINLCDAGCADAVNLLARTTGSDPVPLHKRALGYTHVSDKLGHAGLTALPALDVAPPRIEECPVHLEAVVQAVRPVGRDDPRMAVPACSVEVHLVRAHVRPELLASCDRVNAEAWSPLLMSFRSLFTLGALAVPQSRLAHGSEARYAPWKSGLVRRTAAALLGRVAEHRYGVPDEREEP